MKTLLITGFTALALLTTSAYADERSRGIGRQYTINAGSGLVVNDSIITRNRDRYDNHSRDSRRYDSRRDRDYRDYDRRDSRTSAWVSTGNLSIYWSDGDYGRNRPVYNNRYYGRHDNGLHLGHERRVGRFLRDRYGNCFRIDGNGRFERRVKVRDSYCRF